MASRVPDRFYARTLERAYPATGVYKLALYKDVPNLDVYDPEGECDGVGYEAGGAILTGYRIVERERGADIAFNTTVDWFDVDVRARGAIVYDAESGDVLTTIDFSRHVGVIGGIFTVTLDKDGVVGIGEIKE